MYKFEDVTVCDNYVIREAQRSDCAQIHQMVKDLAALLGAPKSIPKVDAKSLETNGFDLSPPAYKCLVVEYANKRTNGSDSHDQNNPPLIGYAFFSFSFSSWYGYELYLEDIYLEKDHQGKGIGSKLFDSVVEIAVKSNCKNMTFLVVEGNPVNEFYKRRGAVDQTEEDKFHYCSIGYEQLKNLHKKHMNNDQSSVEK